MTRAACHYTTVPLHHYITVPLYRRTCCRLLGSASENCALEASVASSVSNSDFSGDLSSTHRGLKFSGKHNTLCLTVEVTCYFASVLVCTMMQSVRSQFAAVMTASLWAVTVQPVCVSQSDAASGHPVHRQQAASMQPVCSQTLITRPSAHP